ncbi:unnamed protein product [Arctogadus glacialis]
MPLRTGRSSQRRRDTSLISMEEDLVLKDPALKNLVFRGPGLERTWSSEDQFFRGPEDLVFRGAGLQRSWSSEELVFRGPGLQRSWSSEDLVLKVLVLKELVLKVHVPSKVLLSSAQLRVTAKEKDKLG